MRNIYLMATSLMLSAAIQTAAAATQVVGNPQVTMEEVEITPSSFTLTFTPNEDVSSFYCCQFGHGEMEQQFQFFGAWMGFSCYGDMIVAWGTENKETTTHTWKDCAPGTMYDVWVQCLDQNGEYAELQCFTVTTANKGGEGPSIITVEVGEFGFENGYPYQRVLNTPNDQTSRYYDCIITQVGYDQMGGAEGVKQFLMDYYNDPQTRDLYAQFDVDDARWNAEEATSYHACAVGMNINGEWGEMTDIPFRTPGEWGEITWGYGDGENIYAGVGASEGATCTVTAAVQIPQNLVDAYDGARISSISFAVYGNSGQVLDASYFVTNDLSRLDQYSVKLGTLSQGWHSYDLAMAHPLHAGEPVYIGYTATGVSPVAIVDLNGKAGSCLLSVNGSEFEDYGRANGWELGVLATLQSAHFPPQLELADVKDVKVLANAPCELPVSVCALSPTAVSSYTVALKMQKKTVGVKTVECDLHATGALSTAIFELDALEPGSYNYTVELQAINGEPLDEVQSQSAKLIAKQLLLPRTQVVEEGTGTWCGWCIRGMVAMKEMAERYPDSFIGIAVHAGMGQGAEDEFETSSYSKFIDLLNGRFPMAAINRKTLFDPSTKNMEEAFLAQDPWSDGEVKIVEARFTDDTHQKLAITTRSRFADDHSKKAAYRLAFVIMEDNLPAVQTNYYAGGEYGPMGGYEEMGRYIQVELQDVAREIKNYSGLVNSIPTTIKAGEYYEYTYNYKLPATLADLSNVSVVALLQNVEGTEIINADKCTTLLEAGDEAIEAIEADEAATIRYNLQGQRIASPAGLTISKGQKMLMK